LAFFRSRGKLGISGHHRAEQTFAQVAVFFSRRKTDQDRIFTLPAIPTGIAKRRPPSLSALVPVLTVDSTPCPLRAWPPGIQNSLAQAFHSPGGKSTDEGFFHQADFFAIGQFSRGAREHGLFHQPSPGVLPLGRLFGQTSGAFIFSVGFDGFPEKSNARRAFGLTAKFGHNFGGRGGDSLIHGAHTRYRFAHFQLFFRNCIVPRHTPGHFLMSEITINRDSRRQGSFSAFPSAALPIGFRVITPKAPSPTA